MAEGGGADRPGDEATRHRLTGFVDELVVAVVNARVYESDHPRLIEPVERLVRFLGEELASETRPCLRLGMVEGYIVHEKRPLLGASLSARRIIRPVIERGSGGLEFQRGTRADDLNALLKVLNEQVGSDEGDLKAANLRLQLAGCSKIRFLAPYDMGERAEFESIDSVAQSGGEYVASGASSGVRGGLSIEIPVQIYQGVVDVLQGMTISVCQGGKVSFDSAQGSIEKIFKQLKEDAKSMMNTCRYEQYDAFTFGHSVRVCLLALNFASNLTDDQDLLNRIGVAALLHDIGKARVPFEILHCKTRLTVEQRREMERHPSLGAELLLDVRNTDPMAIAAAFGHHKTFNHHGYPKTLHQARLSTVTKIVKICDVYEALTAIRPYKPPMSPTRAYRIMLSMQNHFDPALLRKFIEVNGIYPTGTQVTLSNGDVGIVQEQSEVLDMPIVQILARVEQGECPASGDTVVVDLSEQTSDEKLAISDAAYSNFAIASGG